MNIVLGFGQFHVDETKAHCARILEIVKCKDEKQIRRELQKFAFSLGTFKEKGWRVMYEPSVHCFSEWDEHFGCVVEGLHTHYSDDNPMSPDGYASWGIPFCITYINDDNRGERSYVSVL